MDLQAYKFHSYKRINSCKNHGTNELWNAKTFLFVQSIKHKLPIHARLTSVTDIENKNTTTNMNEYLNAK